MCDGLWVEDIIIALQSRLCWAWTIFVRSTEVRAQMPNITSVHTLYSNNESVPLELANWTTESCYILILASFSKHDFQPIWWWQASRAYPVISRPSSCPYQDSVHIEFWMFCVGCVCFHFVSFWILKQWGGTSMWPSCLNNFLTNPDQKGQRGDGVVCSNQSVLHWWLSHFELFYFKRKLPSEAQQ